MKRTVHGRSLELVEGNIALLDVEAVVNAANTSLVLGSGVAGAIKRHGGGAIQAECDRLAPLPVGEAIATNAGRLKASIVIHAVGPMVGDADADDKLKRATAAALRVAAEKEVASIALPAISSGVFGFPLERCSRIMMRAALDHLERNERPERIVFCLYGPEAFSTFQRTLELLLGPEPS